MSVELKIGNGYLTNSIYIGKVKTYKDGHQEWQDDRVDVTEEAVAAVINHIREKEEKERQRYRIKIDGKTYELRLVEVEE